MTDWSGSLKTRFSRLAQAAAQYAGHAATFSIALGLVLAWLASGPLFHFSDTWQLIINTSTTIVTFLMVFLLQHSQTHDTIAIQAKLDELIHAQRGARDSMIAIESLDDEQLRQVRDGAGDHS